jgi:alkylation response protein AidB-like acyl-CoA dehydrogenase
VDLVVLYEEYGRAALPGPHFVSAVLALRLLTRSGAGCKREISDGVASGRLVATLALFDQEADYAPESVRLQPEQVDGELTLNGRKMFVPFAGGADYLLVLLRTGPAREQLTFFLLPTRVSGVVVEPLGALSNDKLFEVRFEHVKLSDATQLGELHGGWAALQADLPLATVIQSAELVGLSDAAFEMALEYARQRVAFGKPIGAFQAIQHKLAEMMTDRDAARFVVYQAACLINTGEPAAPEVAMAKAFAGTATRRVIKEAHQIFGGAGFIVDHRLNYYYRRQKAIELALADVDEQLATVADRMGW